MSKWCGFADEFSGRVHFGSIILSVYAPLSLYMTIIAVQRLEPAISTLVQFNNRCAGKPRMDFRWKQSYTATDMGTGSCSAPRRLPKMALLLHYCW